MVGGDRKRRRARTGIRRRGRRTKLETNVPICVQTSSVRLPMNCGVALTPRSMVSESTILPILNQRADLRRCTAKNEAEIGRLRLSQHGGHGPIAVFWVRMRCDEDGRLDRG